MKYASGRRRARNRSPSWSGICTGDTDQVGITPATVSAAVLHDIRYSLRTLRKTPVFTLAAILTIALGIAANTSIFSVVNAAMLRSLPYADPDRLVRVAEKNDKLNLQLFSVSALNYVSWNEQTRTFERLGAFGNGSYSLTGRGEPEQFAGNPISPSLAPLLGLHPVAGRSFRDGEDRPAGPLVTMISEGLWRRRFNADRAVIGQTLILNGVSYTLVGVMPPALNLLTGGDVWVPLVIDASRENRLNHLNTVVGRLRPGVTFAQAAAEMDTIGRRVVQQYPEVRDWGIQLQTFSDLFVSGELRTALLVLLGAVALVLLIVCANVANLLLSRAVARQKELAVRAAMGASRGRLARQLLTEGLVLSLAGGVAGLLGAGWAVTLLNSLPQSQQVVTDIRLDSTVLLFTLGASLATGLLFGLAPAWHATSTDLNAVLKQGVRSSKGNVRTLVRSGQAGAQLALATLLVVGAGLLTQSLVRLQHVPLGFNQDRVLTFQLALPAATYDTHAKAWAFDREMLESIQGLPEVQSAGISSAVPFGAGSYTRTPVSTPSRSVMPVGSAVPVDWRVVSPGYFHTLGIPLLSGRDFTEQDAPGALQVTIVSRATARKFWGEDDPIGKVIHIVAAKTNNDYTVVGVVGDVRNTALNQEWPAMYYASSFRLWPLMDVAVRTRGNPEAILPAVRRRIHALDPELPISNVRTLGEWVSASASQPRFNAVLLMAFAGIALVIAAIGIYGVLACSVTHRTQEIGVRMALGADRWTVVGLVVREGLTVSLAGIGVGLAAASGMSRVLASLLFGIDARDPLTFTAAAVALAVVALIACAVPAWKASRVDPIVALRAE